MSKSTKAKLKFTEHSYDLFEGASWNQAGKDKFEQNPTGSENLKYYFGVVPSDFENNSNENALWTDLKLNCAVLWD